AIHLATEALGRPNQKLADSMARKVEVALVSTYGTGTIPSVEDIQDVVERVLIENEHARTAKAYILYRHERARMRDDRRAVRVENIPYKSMWQMLDWAVTHGVETVDKLNSVLRTDRLPWLVAETDAYYEHLLDAAAATILERRGELRFIIVAGPSSSGKTTTMMKIAERLEKDGVHVIPMALDNYFFDLDMHPQDEFGDYDFETPEAMDLPLLNEHLEALDAGRGIDVPHYDFKTGKRTEKTQRFEPGPDTLVLLDTLHGLYPGLTERVPAEHKFKVYIETIGQMKDAGGRYIRWTDVRMLRRMIRDSQHRGYSPERTILHWHYVRRSELKHIIPFQGAADFIVNSSLAYELPFLKRHLHHHLPEFLKKWEGNDARIDGVIRARRVLALLDSIEDVDDDSVVPPTSLLREFIGGGAYDVH
ncbi:MAG: response regulator SirA, partial [Gemmatimonadetes bacterium]|nr:response regulator SirA [Gemmatimonadota bacterium]